ncbi:MAG TPA: phosphate ABC transporter substrate-binding protein PstS [Conexibacter sp.]|jgi:phosphate transport system substrate-binding protein|nr:phosphate ABC transporter substrate-binding protein PstS [Conexibacter sp.]
MRYSKALALGSAAAIALGVAACGSSNSSDSSSSSASSSSTLNGAGSTFQAPLVSEWASRFKEAQGITVNYQPVGSGAGIAQLTAGTVDFAGSDAVMKPEEVAAGKDKGTPVHLPIALGAVTVSYNLDGVKTGLKLDGPTIADIYLGKVTKWNDKAIAGLNPGVSLPSTDISVCHRSDESGTTANFTQFLADYSKAWTNGPGVDKSVQWPVGTGAKGNDGVAGCVKQTPGAVGYVEQAYALQNNFTTAAVKNKAGKWVEPSLDATSAAGVGAKPPANLEFSTINAPGADSYPITAVTFQIVWQDACKAGVSESAAGSLKSWLDYVLGDGQKVAPQLEYAPLPASIQSKAQAKVAGLVCNGAPIQAAKS